MDLESSAESVKPTHSRPGMSRRAWAILSVIIALVTTARLPIIYQQHAAQDEDYFAVPGYTILQSGIPRIPYMPARNDDSSFYHADTMLFTLPPLYFYWQAFCYAVLGPSTGNARLAALIAGIVAAVLITQLTYLLFASEVAAVIAGSLYVASRIVLFPSIIARPDMLCGMLGLLTMLAVYHWWHAPSLRWIAIAGIAIGAGMLTHPFALVFALQAGGIALIGGWLYQRWSHVVILVAMAAAVFSLWLILIMQAPEILYVQFTNNVLSRTGPGLLQRVINPVNALVTQATLYFEHAGAIQAAITLLGTAGVAIWALKRSAPTGIKWAAALAVSALYLHVVLQGTHPTKGYWCYTGGLIFIAVGGIIAKLLDVAGNRVWQYLVTAGVLVAIMIPGSGIRTTIELVRHRGEVAYDGSLFAQHLMLQVPTDAHIVVDPAWIFDFYLAGRSVVLGLNYKPFFDVTGQPYDYLVAGPTSLRDGVPAALDAKVLSTHGVPNSHFTCYGEIYRSPTTEAVP